MAEATMAEAVEGIDRLIAFEEAQPLRVLGPRFDRVASSMSVRAYLPDAARVSLSVDGAINKTVPMEKVHPDGIFRAVIHDVSEPVPYRLAVTDREGISAEIDDPYAFSTDLSDFDLQLLTEGTHFKSYEKLGARIITQNGIRGVHFAVWAPNAKSISVIGNFNQWRTGRHPMEKIHAYGIWTLFIPGLGEGEIYKYAIRSNRDNRIYEKADPYAFQSELRPCSGSVVADLNKFQWQDEAWLKARRETNPLNRPVSIYEVHLGSWKKDEASGWGFLNYRTLAHQLVEYVKYMGYTHIELLPVMEHPLDQSWGYQVLGYFAPTSRFGTPEDFMYFVDYCHRNDIGVIVDWVPAHFPKDGHGLTHFDGSQIFAYENWRRAEHKEWGTLVFDYGRTEVRNFLISSALFWLDRYHVDGLRADAVASMLYLDYSRQEGEWEANIYGGRENLEAISLIKRFNEVVHEYHPGVMTIAEESTAWGGVSRPTYMNGLGFTMKWNMGWMHDTLEYFSKDPIYRRHHQNMLTFSFLYAFTENFVLPISHDEVVHGKRALLEKMPGDDGMKFANAKLFLGYMFTHPGKKLLFMGNDFGQRGEWDSNHSIEWHLLQYAPHQELNRYVRDLNHVYAAHRALYEVDFEPQGFEWIDFTDTSSSVFSFIRWSRDYRQVLLTICNFTPVARHNYRVGVPLAGYYREIVNSDAREYGGSGIGNSGGVHTDPVPWQSRPCSLNLNFPPLATCIFKLEL